MSAPAGSAVSNSTDARPPRPAQEAAAPRPGTYLRRLAERRAAEAVRRQIGYGLVLGWVLTLVAGFIYVCVPSRVDWLWGALVVVGWLHLAAAVVLPQMLAWPERLWTALARLLGGLVMAALLTTVYYLMFWPAGLFRRRRGTHPFHWWSEAAPRVEPGWEKIDLVEPGFGTTDVRRRSMPVLLGSVIAHFFRRSHYLVLPILIVLLLLGLALFFVQGSALAPFIYTLF
ncbi:MAG: DUF5989 family protein [Thermoguttaceae bacterium]|jgi:hypothetical protein|nr:DUF5989 family protein [Thermoguttaceae bacterium]